MGDFGAPAYPLIHLEAFMGKDDIDPLSEEE